MMKTLSRHTRSLAVLALSGCFAVPSFAKDYYVSTIHPSRNDSNAGTSPNAPWATFNKVKQVWGSTIKAGDTVHLERGSRWTWSGEQFWVMTQGGSSAGGSITIRGDDYGTGSLAVLEKVGGSRGNNTFWLSESASYVTFRDFIVDGGVNNGAGSTAFYIGGPSQSGDIRNINILNMVLRNLGNGVDTYISGIYLSPYNNHAIRTCLIEGNDISGYTSHGLNHYPGQKQATPHNNTIHNVTYRNNRIHDAAPELSTVGAGIHIACGGSGNVVEYNYVEGHNHDGGVFLTNGSNSEPDLVLRYNVFRNNSINHGILVYGASDSAIGTTLNVDIYGNIITGNRGVGINIVPENRFNGSINIFNNTLYNNNQLYNSDAEVDVDDAASGVQVALRNNVIIHSASVGACLDVASGFQGSLTHTHNQYWHTSGTSQKAVKYQGTDYTVANVKNFESTAQNGNPSLTSLTQPPTSVHSSTGALPDGFSPATGSPCLDRGTSLAAAYANSINLAARPQAAAWDIGAYERSVAVPIPSPPSNLTVVP